MPATYSPPYESPIEDLFAYNVVKYLAEGIELIPQVPVQTICGRFVLDFVLRLPGVGKIGIECDGRDFHDESRDEWRDAMILGAGSVDAIYRLRGCDIHHHIEDLLFLLSRLEPWVMPEWRIKYLEVLATPEVKSRLVQGLSDDIYHVRYQTTDQERGSLRMEVRRSSVPPGQRRFWQTAYNYAQSVGGGGLDDVIASYRQGSI